MEVVSLQDFSITFCTIAIHAGKSEAPTVVDLGSGSVLEWLRVHRTFFGRPPDVWEGPFTFPSLVSCRA